jgi:hypothetical protein
MIVLFGVVRTLAVFLFLYLTWRYLRDDYEDMELLGMSWWILVAFLAGGRIGYGLINWGVWNEAVGDWFSVWTKPGFSYTIGYVAAILMGGMVSRYNEWKVWILAEGVIRSLGVMILLMLLGEMLAGWRDIRWLVHGLVVGLMLVIGRWLGENYRSFVWYLSGKKGFVFLALNSIYGLIRLGLAFWFKEGQLNYILYLSWSLISGVGLIMLAEVLNPLMVKMKRKSNEDKQ